MARNVPIGEVECAHKGCSERCKVYRFQQKTGERKARFGGKLYAQCPVHGRLGADGTSAMQEYLLENATIWQHPSPERAEPMPEKPKPAPVEPVRAEPATTPKTPEKATSWRPLINL